MPNYQELRKPFDIVTRLSERRHVVIFSSSMFADLLLSAFQSGATDSSDLLSHRYSILFGSFWGDPRHVARLEKEMTLLTEFADIKDVYALRHDVKGKRRFREHMSSIRLHSPRFENNKFIQRYWESDNSCSLDNSGAPQCTDDNPFNSNDSPIANNYKALLILDAAAVLAKYIEDYRNRTGNVPTQFFENDFYGFMDGNVLEVENKWTGNQWSFGIPAGNGKSFEWVQPMEWRYEVMKLYTKTGMIAADIYGTWSIRLNTTDSRRSTLLTLKSFGSGNTVYPCEPMTTSRAPTSCPPTDLDSMTALVATIGVSLFICILVIVLKQRDTSRFRAAITSPGVVTMGCVALLSIAISLWIIFGDEAGNCDNRVDDFFVTVINSVCFTVLLIALVVPLVTSRLLRLLVKVGGFVFVMMIQLAVSIQAHLVEGGGTDHDDDDPVTHCYNERGKVLSSVSYLYGNVLLVLCVLLLIHSLCSKRGKYYQRKWPFKLMSGFLAVLLMILYTVMVTVLLWVDSVSCVMMGRVFMVMAVFPAAICMAVVAVLLLTDSNDHDVVFDSRLGDIESM